MLKIKHKHSGLFNWSFLWRWKWGLKHQLQDCGITVTRCQLTQKSIFPSSCTPSQKARTFAFFQLFFPGWSNIYQHELSILKQGLLKVWMLLNRFVGCNKVWSDIVGIDKYRQVWRRLIKASGAVFTTLHFIRNLRIFPTSQSVRLHLTRKASRWHSSLSSPFVTYEENKVLWIRPRMSLSKSKC